MSRAAASGAAVDYGEFEERVARATAKAEQHVHQIALSGLDVDVPFRRVWGKRCRRVHRGERTHGSLSGPVVGGGLDMSPPRRRELRVPCPL
jgi:hypothetical protein